MQFLRLFALVAPVLAFTIPEGQPDGTYSVSYVDGQEVHTLIKKDVSITDSMSSHPAAQPLRRASSFSTKRQGADVSCGGSALNHGDTDTANNELDAQCGGGVNVPGRQAFYSIVGCTVAYACNFSYNSQVCYASNRGVASAEITGHCGWYNSGWATTNEMSYGYENYCTAAGSNFCGHGRT